MFAGVTEKFVRAKPESAVCVGKTQIYHNVISSNKKCIFDHPSAMCTARRVELIEKKNNTVKLRGNKTLKPS